MIAGRARSPPQAGGSGGETKALASVLKLELLADKNAVEIADIWSQHFAAKVNGARLRDLLTKFFSCLKVLSSEN